LLTKIFPETRPDLALVIDSVNPDTTTSKFSSQKPKAGTLNKKCSSYPPGPECV